MSLHDEAKKAVFEASAEAWHPTHLVMSMATLKALFEENSDLLAYPPSALYPERSSGFLFMGIPILVASVPDGIYPVGRPLAASPIPTNREAQEGTE